VDKFTTLTAVACPLGLENIDTDQLMPARFMSRSRADGYGAVLLHDMRRDARGAPHTNSPLDDARFAGAQVLVARRNFGCGSSREAAVYALWDFGIRCVLAPSFGDIFASNAIKNGLLPAVMGEADIDTVLSILAGPGKPHMTVDLDQTRVAAGGQSFPFSIDPVWRLQLLNGWDDIDMTLRYKSEIASFRATRVATFPFVLPDN
jgi:3-isopropylmalate/(R)-2-methylmalate dehydratase small subunit